jgi:TRAP-type mannitol/chloroaromatic compound transport system substrate-binding protein
MKRLRLPLIASAVFLTFVFTAPTADAAKTMKFKVQTALTATSMYMDILKSFGANLKAMSGGRLEAEFLPAGAVVKTNEIHDAVSSGVIEAGFTWPHFASGKHPAAFLFADQPSVNGMDQLGFLSWYYEGEGYDLYRELYKDHMKVNVRGFIVLASGGQPLGWFKKPINSLADFQKIKYRAPPGLTGKIFHEMGIAAVALPGGEIVPAAQKGVIDAAEWINPGEDIKLGLQQIWKNYYLQGIHQASDLGEIIVNNNFWKKLSPELQAIFRGAAQASVMQSLAAHIYRNAVALDTLKKDYGVKVHDTPADLYPEFLRAAKKVTEDAAKDNAFFAKVLASQQKFANTIVPYWTKQLDLYHRLGNATLGK